MLGNLEGESEFFYFFFLLKKKLQNLNLRIIRHLIDLEKRRACLGEKSF